MPPDEPNEEEQLEELPEDDGTPFNPAPDLERDPDTEPDDERQAEETLDPTHPATDSNIEIDELYQQGLSSAAGASEPNAGDTVEGYHKPGELRWRNKRSRRRRPL